MGGSTTKTEQKMPAFQEKFLTETVIPYAESIANREFTPYEGKRVAGMTGLQKQALAGYGNLDTGDALYGQAADTYGQLSQMNAPRARAAQLSGADINRYMSPYTDAVITSGLRDIGGAQNVALEQQGAQAQAAGAFGGSRHGIAESETRKAYGQQASDFVGQQRANAFQQAQQAAQFDVANQQQAALANQQAALQAAQMRGQAAAGLGSIAGQQLQSQLAGLGAQMQAGEAQRALKQGNLDALYAEFARQQDFPLTGLSALASAASGIPAGYGSTMQTYGGMGPTLGAIGSLGMGFGPQGFGFFGR